MCPATSIPVRHASTVTGGTDVKRALILLVMGLSLASGTERRVEGTITYMATGTVYVSLGREAGLQDSALVYVVGESDTLAVMRVVALSSRSLACKVIRGNPVVGARVVAAVAEQERAEPTPAVPAVAAPVTENKQPDRRDRKPEGVAEALNIRGRIAAQFYGTRYDLQEYDVSQPGLVVNARASLRDVPLTLEMYTNLRMLARRGRPGTVNQSRVHRLAVEYDDGTRKAVVGRFAPAALPSVGYTDGMMLAHRWGDLTVGALFGLQPSYTQRGISTDHRKMGLYVAWEGARQTMASAGYARTMFNGVLDREVVTARTSFGIGQRLFVYAHGDLDLRKKQGDAFAFSPRPSLATVSLNYRVMPAISLGAGLDATRPMYPYSLVRTIPDSLLDTRLRAGASLSFHIGLPAGITLSNTYTPRSSGDGFAREYSENASLSMTNLASSGVIIRTHVSLNSSAYTKSTGYGVQAQRNLLGIADLTLRFHRYSYTVRRIEGQASSTTLGADVMVTVTKSLMLIGSYDRLEGYGMRSHALFAELSLRF